MHALIVEHVRFGSSNVACSNPTHTLVVVLVPLVVTCIPSEGGVVTTIQRAHVVAHGVYDT